MKQIEFEDEHMIKNSQRNIFYELYILMSSHFDYESLDSSAADVFCKAVRIVPVKYFEIKFLTVKYFDSFHRKVRNIL